MVAPKNGNGTLIPAALGAITLLINAVSYIAWTTTSANIERIEKHAAAALDHVEKQATARATAIELQFLRLREHDEFTRRLDAQILKIETRLAETATRSELDTRLGINSSSIIQVRQDIDVLKRDLGQTYPLKDALGNIQGRLDRIEQWSRAPPPSQIKP